MLIFIRNSSLKILIIFKYVVQFLWYVKSLEGQYW